MVDSPTLPPGPRLPRLVQTYLAWRRLASFPRWCARRYGDVFTLRALPWGTAVGVANPAMIREIFTGDPRVFHTGEGMSWFVPLVGPRALIVLDEEEHMRLRRKLLPPFHGRAVQAYRDVVEERVAEEVASWPVGRRFRLRPRMRAITLDTIVRAVLGVEETDRLEELRHVLPRAIDINGMTLAMWVFEGLGRFGPWRAYGRNQERMRELLLDEIRRRRAAPDLDRRTDVLSLLIRGDGLGDEELRDQAVTLLLAGHDTVTDTLSWAFERLLRHPDVLRRARDAAYDRDDEYLDAVAKETLRVRTLIPAVPRKLTQPVELGGHRLPAGVTLLASISLLHESPELFPEPEAFRPERFLEGQGGPYSWIPFGGGVRRCLGAGFAAMEIRTVLGAILRRTVLSAPDPRDEPPRSNWISLVPGRDVVVERVA